MNKSIITTVITQKHAQKAVIKHFMEEKPVLVGTEFLDWNTLIKSNSITPSNLDYYWRCVNIIHTHKKGFPILSKSLNYPSSVDEFIRFMEEMADENFDLEDCPDTSNKDKELKELLTLLDPKSHPKWICLNQFNTIDDASHIKIIPFYQSYSLKNQINQLLGKGAQLISIEKVEPNYEAYYAKNPRMEAYGVVQKIAQSHIDYDKTVIVCLDPETIEPLTHYLTQLEIPYTYQKSKTLIESRQFIDCLNFVLNPNMDKLLDVIKSGLIQSDYTLQLLQYIEIASPNLSDFNQPFTHLKNTLYPNYIWDKRNIKHLLDIESKSESIRCNYLPLINFNIQSSMDEMIKQLFKLFVSYSKNNSALNTLRQCLQTSLPYLNSLDMIPYLIHQLEQLSLSETSSTGIQIVGLKDAMIPYMDQMYILGCSSKNYPQYPVHSGFFDEVYFNQLINGTSSERYLWHMTQLETIFSLSKNTCFTYSVGNYEGKGSSLSFEIEDFLKRKNGPSFSPLELIESEVKHEREFKLDPSISKQLFFKDNNLYGSVSSFESFFRCPYQYYLKSGLKLYVQKPFTIDNSLMGTISHAVFEHSVRDAGKDYPNYGLRHLDDTLDPMFDDLKRLYPKQVSRINSIQSRAKVVIQESLLQFSEFEKFTSYVPFSVEYEFNQSFEVDENRKIHLKGFMDRVDVNENYFRVIDYKSSTKELKEKSILSGNKLQLPTYAVIGQDIFNHIASGIYYASFGQKNVVSIKPYKYTMSYGTDKLSEADYKLEYDKKRQFEGITFCDAQNNDSSIYFIKGLKDDNGTVISKVEYSFDLLKQAIYELYSLLFSSLDEGIIEKDVVEGSCKYCDYKAICQFRGDEKKERNRTNVSRISLSKEVIEEDETES